LWRSRWAAIGAALAVTLGGGGWFVASASSSLPSSVVTIDPVRILDTRDPVDVGLSGPFVSPVSQKLQVTGSVATSTGNRTVVPPGATGVLLNVTVVDPTAAGFVSIRPGDVTGAPSTSSLNVTAGQTVPNSVQVGLPTTGVNAGQIDITYDALGVVGPTTDMLIDVVGYMVAVAAGSDAALLARIDALDAEIVALKASIAANIAGVAALDSAQPFAVTNLDDFEAVTSAGEVVVSVTVTAPVAGQVTVNSTTRATEVTAGDTVACSITAATAFDFSYQQRWESPGPAGEASQLAGTRTFDIAAGATATYNLFCVHVGVSGSSFVDHSVLTAIFTPAP
jgi:hypothetical protein